MAAALELLLDDHNWANLYRAPVEPEVPSDPEHDVDAPMRSVTENRATPGSRWTLGRNELGFRHGCEALELLLGRPVDDKAYLHAHGCLPNFRNLSSVETICPRHATLDCRFELTRDSSRQDFVCSE